MLRAFLVLFLLGVVVPGNASAQDGGTPPAPTCVTWRKEARYSGAGYDHLVHVRNACEAPAACTVSTNVNPEPQRVRVLPGHEETVLTFRGSPAYEFTPRVECTLEPARH